MGSRPGTSGHIGPNVIGATSENLKSRESPSPGALALQTQPTIKHPKDRYDSFRPQRQRAVPSPQCSHRHRHRLHRCLRVCSAKRWCTLRSASASPARLTTAGASIRQSRRLLTTRQMRTNAPATTLIRSTRRPTPVRTRRTARPAAARASTASCPGQRCTAALPTPPLRPLAASRRRHQRRRRRARRHHHRAPRASSWSSPC